MTTLREKLLDHGLRFLHLRAEAFTNPPHVMPGDWVRVDLDAASATESGLYVLERFTPTQPDSVPLCRRVEVGAPLRGDLRIVGRVTAVIPREVADAPDRRIDALPAGLRRIADVIGYDLALHLMATLPRAADPVHGERILPLYIPKKLTAAAKLVDALTTDPLLGGGDYKTWQSADAAASDRAEQAAQKLVDAFGGQKLDIPKAMNRTNSAMHHGIGEAMARGVPAKEIADQLCATEARLLVDWVASGSVPSDKPRKISLTIKQIRNIGKEFWKR